MPKIDDKISDGARDKAEVGDETRTEVRDARALQAQEAEKLGYKLAAGLLGHDWPYLLIPYLITVLPQLFQSLAPSLDVGLHLGLLILERFLWLIALYMIAIRWIGRLRASGTPGPAASDPAIPLRLIAMGFAFWLAFMLPMMAQFTLAPDGMKVLFLVLLIPAGILVFRYYFYFFPIVCGVRGTKEILAAADSYTRNDRYVSIKAMLAPIGAMSLVMSMITLLSPDGRYQVVSHLESLSGGIFWVLGSYVALGLCLALCEHPEWERLGFDANRESRLTAVQVGGREWLSSLLLPKNGVKMLLISLIVWFGNLVQLMNTPPPATVEIKGAEIHGNRLRLELLVTSPDFNFRGFQPVHFALAGEKRELVVSERPERADIESTTDDVRVYFPEQTGPLTLRLDFAANRSGKDLVALEDLNLWYRNVKIGHIDTKKAKVLNEPQAVSPAADPSTQEAAGS